MSSSPYTLDPIDNFCAISGQSTLIIDDKLYITPGYAEVSDNGTRVASSPWVRVIDLSRSFSLNRTASASTVLPTSIVPINLPDVQGASFWYDSVGSSIIYAQGAPTVDGGVIRPPAEVSFGRRGKSWIGNYNKETKSFTQWEEIDTPFSGQTGLVSSLRRIFDPVGRKGYIYGGTVASDDPNVAGQRAQILTYDAAQQSWTNQTVSQGAFDDVGVAVPYRNAAGKFLGIVFGGNLNGTPLSMETIFIHDPETNTWYRQRTNGNPPKARGHFCATTITAPDNSSTQVLINGGFGDGHFSDIYALSIPSFTWTQIEGSSPGLLPGPGIRLQPSCEIINNHFLGIFGGRNLFDGDTAHCDTDQNALFMYDLNKRNWILNYDAADKGEYSVPTEVFSDIGGNSSGYATMTVPPDGFADPTMAQLFALSTPSPTGPSNTDIPPPPEPPAKKSSVAGIAGGVIGGFAALALLGAFIWFLRRRKQARQINPPDLPPGYPPRPPGTGMHAVEAPGENLPPIMEVDGFPTRPKYSELGTGNYDRDGIMKPPERLPPIELPVAELPAENVQNGAFAHEMQRR
ncbi:hypothetical protein ABW20_dc0109713 [Dactylellina cionopaga]|nr:hypothetical protein ABW20_dc0109713 [Dactylellina cionopaga]